MTDGSTLLWTFTSGLFSGPSPGVENCGFLVTIKGAENRDRVLLGDLHVKTYSASQLTNNDTTSLFIPSHSSPAPVLLSHRQAPPPPPPISLSRWSARSPSSHSHHGRTKAFPGRRNNRRLQSHRPEVSDEPGRRRLRCHARGNQWIAAIHSARYQPTWPTRRRNCKSPVITEKPPQVYTRKKGMPANCGIPGPGL